jgi:hypothetical protein
VDHRDHAQRDCWKARGAPLLLRRTRRNRQRMQKKKKQRKKHPHRLRGQGWASQMRQVARVAVTSQRRRRRGAAVVVAAAAVVRRRKLVMATVVAVRYQVPGEGVVLQACEAPRSCRRVMIRPQMEEAWNPEIGARTVVAVVAAVASRWPKDACCSMAADAQGKRCRQG